LLASVLEDTRSESYQFQKGKQSFVGEFAQISAQQSVVIVTEHPEKGCQQEAGGLLAHRLIGQLVPVVDRRTGTDRVGTGLAAISVAATVDHRSGDCHCDRVVNR